ncbi:MAG: precorrin-3B C(17)-methyltransferase [Cyanobacteria bacterium]|nr:precorrin-3B C(17)-methyltransferase [Cyanobacteriota bacterium]MDA1247258.1 precorrin-3B C(17)-methyltransferase [Cyanobacteriota bacterium]
MTSVNNFPEQEGQQAIRWGLGFSPASTNVLEQLLQAGLIDFKVGIDNQLAARDCLVEKWSTASGFVIVGACGLVTRLIAPLLVNKQHDPAVVVVDPQGRFAIPLLGGHAAGAERLSYQIAACLGGQAVLTGATATAGLLSLDSFGKEWGWQRGQGDWSALMHKAARQDQPVRLVAHYGSRRWLELEATTCLLDHAGTIGSGSGENPDADLVVDIHTGPGCRWHPPSLWLGIGCERNTSLSLLERLLGKTLDDQQLAPESVAGLASIDLKADEPALLALAAKRGWPVRWFGAKSLAAVPVPTPSAAVAQEVGTASVAEAAALLAAGPAAQLLQAKQIEHAKPGELGAATLAVALAESQWAPERGQLHLVGSGPGSLELLTADARRALTEATVWVGYGLYLDLLEPLRRPDQLRWNGQLTEERARCALALQLASQGLNVALVSSGDSGIYAMAGLALELWLASHVDGRPSFSVHPGISALQLAAARAGAPLMHDFCTISLSDRLTPWAVIERRLQAAATGDFVIALYNPRSLGRDWQLARARELLLEGRPASTPVALARQLGRPDESFSLHSLGELPVEQVDMLTVLLIGNCSSYVKDGRMVTPRGYPGAELS